MKAKRCLHWPGGLRDGYRVFAWFVVFRLYAVTVDARWGCCGAGGRRVWPVVAAALVFAVLAPVSGAVVKALGVDNWWWLVGIAAAVGAVGGVVVKHFASRWKRQAKERESRRQAVDRAALRLRGGRVRVRDIDDPTVLGCIRPGFRWG